MSVKAMGLVWDADLPKDEKFILLAYVDHADHNGRGMFPSVPLIAWKTGYTERGVRKIKSRLIEKGVLVEYGTSEYGTPIYRLELANLSVRKERELKGNGRPKTPEPRAGVSEKTPEQNDKTPERGSAKPSFKPSLNLSDQLFAELVEFLDVNVTLATPKTKRLYESFVMDLEDAGEPPGAIMRFGRWWHDNDWRGQKGQKPTLDQMAQCWNQAKRDGTQKRVMVIE